MTREGIYFWIQKMALRRSRQAAKTQELVRKTISPLQVKMDAATAEKFAEAEKLAALSCSKKMATLLLLRNRGLSAATRRGFNEGLIAKEIAAEASCSRGSLYRWAGEWQRADSNWDRFLESACSNRARKELTKHFDFLKSGAREN